MADVRVVAGPTDPARAERYRKAGIEDHRWSVWVDDQEVGIGGPKTCTALAVELRGDESLALRVRAFAAEQDEKEKKR